jgi:glycosyltransferase involved in cell wall biosynthesis
VPLTGGAARNLGCASSSAHWISFLDADDLWEPGSRRALLDACERDAAELGLGMMTSFRHGEGSERLVVPERRVGVAAGATVVSRRGWDAVGPFDETLRAGEYIEWFNRFRLTGLRQTRIGVDVLRRRLHVASTTARQLADARARADYLDVVRRWMTRTG